MFHCSSGQADRKAASHRPRRTNTVNLRQGHPHSLSWAPPTTSAETSGLRVPPDFCRLRAKDNNRSNCGPAGAVARSTWSLGLFSTHARMHSESCIPGFPREIHRRLGGDIEMKRRAPTGNSVSVSCPCRACGRGGAAWAGELREPSLARAK
eukprot:3498439-Alexandrium_andersonii.AAC.1